MCSIRATKNLCYIYLGLVIFFKAFGIISFVAQVLKSLKQLWAKYTHYILGSVVLSFDDILGLIKYLELVRLVNYCLEKFLGEQ